MLFNRYVDKGLSSTQLGHTLNLETQVILSEWIRPARECSVYTIFNFIHL
jgi:hypothetical protein